MTTTLKTEPHMMEKTSPTVTGKSYLPAVDLVEHEGGLTLYAEMPGVEPDAVDIQFEDGILTLMGNVAPRQLDESKFLYAEYGVGGFRRQFRLSDDFDVAAAHATVTNGVLKLEIPKCEAAKPRKIMVKVQ